ncbi:MAG: hypothetical protein WC004_04905 [Candidatus Absconditabacterales bacterium]
MREFIKQRIQQLPQTSKRLIIGFLALQIVIRGIVSYSNNHTSGELQGSDTIMSLREQGKYKQITEMTARSRADIMRQQAASLKMGHSEIRTGLYKDASGVYPDRWNTILKAGYLKDKGAPADAEKLLSYQQHKDYSIISLIMSLRASLYCDQKRRLECNVLAQDSTRLDPLAPLGRGINGMALRQQRIFAEAKKNLETYVALSGNLSHDIQFYRGIVTYYTRNRDISTGSLMTLVNHPVYGFDAMIFLGRTYYDLKDTTAARTWFARAQQLRSTGSALPYLWLGRTAMIWKDYPTAMRQYLSGYELFPNAIELLSDILKLATLQNNTALIEQINSSITFAVGANASNHEIAGRTYKELKQYDLAQEYISKGLSYLTGTNPLLLQQQTTALHTQLHDLLIIQIFNNLKNKQSSPLQYAQLAAININTGQVAFMQGIEKLTQGDDAAALGHFDKTIFKISELDARYILARYTVLSKEYGRTYQIINNLPIQQGQEAKRLRIQRAIATRQGLTIQANGYLQQLYGLKAVATPASGQVVDETYLWQQAYRGFRPRIHWVSNYMTP